MKKNKKDKQLKKKYSNIKFIHKKTEFRKIINIK